MLEVLKSKFSLFINKIFEIYNKHPEIYMVLGLSLLFYFIFFHGIGTYYLMDVDETRYVAMSRDMYH